MLSDWVSVFSSTQLHQVELLKQLLDRENIPCIILNRRDSFYITIGEIDLMVPRDQAVRAKKVVTDSAL